MGTPRTDRDSTGSKAAADSPLRRVLGRWRGPGVVLAAAGLVLSMLSTGSASARADLRATDKVASSPRSANAPVRVAEFVAECPFTHRLPDDPIVFPGLPGASHMHSFFGNDSTNAHTDLAALKRGRTSCSPTTDLSSYWTPTLYAGGKEIEPTGTTFYYLGEGVRDDVIATIKP
ncbi:DUF1996 domain-containing protein, partial [Streptomyces albiflaviniger]|nr:DUF1996 domain-containing protein [Streptomyces albiflaviniger]